MRRLCRSDAPAGAPLETELNSVPGVLEEWLFSFDDRLVKLDGDLRTLHRLKRREHIQKTTNDAVFVTDPIPSIYIPS